MIRKFATVSRVQMVRSMMWMAILAGAATVYAQQPPAQPAAQPPAEQPQSQQQPDSSSSGSQEASPEETTISRKKKAAEFRKWAFNVGGGASLTNGSTKTFVRSGGGIGAAGVARNFSRYLGLRFDFQFDNLPLRSSALQLAQAPSATNHVFTFAFDPIINIPVTSKWGGYVLFGPAYFHRSGKLDSSTTIPGSACNPFFTWWGSCNAGSLPISGNFLSESQNQFGYNFGGGVTRSIGGHKEIYAEFRYLHGKHSGITTDLRPITVGIRW